MGPTASLAAAPLQCHETFLRALVSLGVATVLITETLSVFGAITGLNLAIAWCCALAIAIVYRPRGLSFHLSRDWFVLALGLPILLICGVVCFTAILSPPNSADAMAYHIPRVIYWAQQHSVRFFPTAYLNQIMLQPAAEYMMLQVYELWGGDRLLNLVQFLGFVGSIIGVSSIAAALGLTSRGQILAALFCATLPSAILQASGAKNDLLLAFWLVCMVLFAVRSTQTGSWTDYSLMGCSAGLALATKATAYLFAPFLLIAIFVWRTPEWRKATVTTLAGIILINGPQFLRNFDLSHSILGFDSAQGDGKYRWRNEQLGWKPAVSNLLRNTSEQFGARSDRWNRAVYTTVLGIHSALGIDPQDPGTTWPLTKYSAPQNSNHEANANCRWHLALLCAAFPLAAYEWWRKKQILWTLYSVALLGGFLSFCFYLKWQPFLSRLELPLFVLGAPLAAHLLQSVRVLVLQLAVCLFLVNNSRPLLFENWTRPLKGTHSLLSEPRDLAYFNDMVQWNNRESYMQAVDVTANSGCKDIGLDTSENQLEYPFEALLRERDPSVRFVHVGVINASAKYYSTTPHPCAVLCLDCAGMESKRALYAGIGPGVQIGKFVLFSAPK